MIFSVIVPTYNRLKSLKRTLESIFLQEHPEYEIVVVDDGSTDGTCDFLSEIASSGKIRFVTQENRGPASARNTGIKITRGRFLAFTDDDCVVPRTWLKQLQEGFKSVEIAIVGGAARNRVIGNLFSETSQQIVNYFVSELNAEGRMSGFLTSNNIAYRREALTSAGGFDERFRKAGGEERALHAIIMHRGGRSIFTSKLIVDHYHDMSARSFFRQQRNYGRGAYFMHKIVLDELHIKNQYIPIALYARLFKSFFDGRVITGIQKSILFLVAEVMVVTGYAMEAVSPRQASLFNNEVK